MKIVISGSEGFIGKHLSKKLAELNIEIIPLDIIQGIDVCNWDHIHDVNDFDVALHLANRTYVPDSYNHPQDFYATNFNGTLNMLELCRNNNAKFIYLSSYIYGQPDYLPIDEEHPVKAFNPYAQSKVICEEICKGYSRDFKVPVIIFRPFNIYGPGQNEDFLIPKMIRQSKLGKIEIRDLRPKRDYIHVEDAVRAITRSLEYSPPNGFELFNLGYGKSYSVKEVADIIISKTPGDISLSSSEEIRDNEVLDTVANIEKAGRLLGWQPQIDLITGIRGLIKDK